MVVNIGRGDIRYIEDNFEFLGDGCEANVYRKDLDTVIKIYKDNNFMRKLDEESIKELKEINTHRILMPMEELYDEFGKLIGYLRKFKQNYNYTLKNASGYQLLEEFDLLKEDAFNLASSNYTISDLHRDNIIYDGNLYLIDPGSYEKIIDEEFNTKIYNIESLNRLIIDDIIGYDLEQFTSKTKARLITDDLHRSSEYIGDVIKEELGNSKTLRKYTRNLAKRY